MQIAKWGNSLAVRLPVSLVKKMKLSAGDEVEFNILDERVLCLQKKIDTKDILSRLRNFRGKMPEDFFFDREEANER